MSNYQVITCQGMIPREPYYCLEAFYASLKRFGVTPTILGQKPYGWKWGGLGSKAKWLKRAITEGIITADVVIFTDSFDVVYSSHPEAIVDRFIAMNIPIVWGAEKACFSDASLAPLHPPTPFSYKYLNSGWGIGRTDAFKEALEEMNPDAMLDDHRKADGTMHEDNDQNAWMRQMLFGKTPIGLDSACVLVQNYCGVKPEEISFEPNGKIRNIETGSYPLVMHWNGPAKSAGLMKPILKHLGL